MPDLAGNPQSGDQVEYPYGPRPPSTTDSPVWPQAAPEAPLAGSEGPLVVAIGLGVIFASGNFAVCPLMAAFNRADWGALPVFVLIGAILAQAGLLSAGLVFGDGSLWVRMIVCWGTAVFLWGCWAAGRLTVALFCVWSFDWGEQLRFGVLSIPLVGLAIQSPLWLVRCYLGWRLTRSGTGASAVRPLSIGDYLIGTAVTAVSITCARLAPQPDWDNSSYWPAWAIVFASIAGASLLSVIPAMLAMFRLRDRRLGLYLLLGYGFVAGMTTLAILIRVFGFPGGPGAWRAVAVVVVFVSLAGCLGLGMKAARDLGFELVLSRNQQP